MEAANRDTAHELLERAKQLMQNGKAIDAKRLVERAQRMCPTDLGRQLSKECEAAAEKDTDESNATSRGHQEQQAGWIHPAYRNRVAAIALIVLLLAAYRFAGGDPILAGLQWGIGRLPGDINYSYSGEGSSVHVYFPITTCIIMSLLLNLLQRG